MAGDDKPEIKSVAQGDGPPPGSETWKKETKGIERVIDVSLTLEEPQTAGWIAEEALVSEQSAREHLQLLADLGVLTATTARGVTKYQTDTAFLRYREVSKLVEQHSKEKLVDMAEKVKTMLEEVKETYDAETPDELRSRAAAEDTSVEEIQEYRKVASEWESLKQHRSVIEEALARYEEFDRGTATA